MLPLGSQADTSSSITRVRRRYSEQRSYSHLQHIPEVTLSPADRQDVSMPTKREDQQTTQTSKMKFLSPGELL